MEQNPKLTQFLAEIDHICNKYGYDLKATIQAFDRVPPLETETVPTPEPSTPEVVQDVPAPTSEDPQIPAPDPIPTPEPTPNPE